MAIVVVKHNHIYLCLKNLFIVVIDYFEISQTMNTHWYLLLDDATVKLCIAGSACSFATVGDAKAMEFSSIASLSAVKAEPSPLSQALTPSMATMSESIKSLQAQQLVCIAVYYGK